MNRGIMCIQFVKTCLNFLQKWGSYKTLYLWFWLQVKQAEKISGPNAMSIASAIEFGQ